MTTRRRFAVALLAAVAVLATLPLASTSSAAGASNSGKPYFLCPPAC